MYLYLKALHIVFIVTWFSGLFYIVRLFIYNREAHDKPELERSVLQQQYSIMIRRLWLGITWPSAILTFILGVWLWISLGVTPRWLLIKLVFVAALFLYHLSLHVLYKQQSKGIFKYNSMQLRIWNEAATIFLIAIVMLVVVKQGVSLLWGGLGLILLMIIFMIAIKIYKAIRMKTDSSPQKK
jgi:putative membrane protein